MILKKFICGPLQNNVMVLACSRTLEGVVVDPAIGSIAKVSSFVERESIHLTRILLTHSHWDHIAEVSLFKEKYGIGAFIHKADSQNLLEPGSDGIALPFFPKGVQGDGFLEEGAEIFLGDLRIEVLHTPGHSPGSVCFYIREKGLLLSGDTLFKGTMGSLSLPTSDRYAMEASLKKLASLSLSTRVIPGHGAETTIGAEGWLQQIV